ncbi:MAG: IS630 family transposase [Bacteroidetes bacterium]|nr:IS630 family transposase [Bacteroidota bacterium]MCB0847802.1 IS630 family transposase [Bacteroidota bacterium]MCB0851963.1 IS630 family transposase [Bacteroidota bacterium]
MALHLSESDRIHLRQLQRNFPDKTTYIKITVILLLDKGDSAEEIAEDLGIGLSTVYRYQSVYLSDGLDTYLATNYKGRWGKLSSLELSQLRDQLRTFLYTDSRQIICFIAARFGVSYSSSGVSDLLRRIGFSYKKTKEVPCKADLSKQLTFVEQTLPPMLKEAQRGDARLYFVDGVHPTHNTRSTYGWIETGTERGQLTVSGRDRVNINAALNALDHTDVQVVEADRINAQSTQDLYQKLIEKHPQAKTIYVIQDNARYYRNKQLSKWVENTPIQPVFLPPYSPNLNLIERLWKFLRKKVINTQFFRTKQLFRQAILDFFDHIDQYKSELETLLSLKFQLIPSQSFAD